jgi:calcium-dependent protein kinase
MKSFNADCKLQTAVATFISSQLLSAKETVKMRKTFRELDENGDGKLSREELVNGYKKILKSQSKAEEEVDRIMT